MFSPAHGVFSPARGVFSPAQGVFEYLWRGEGGESRSEGDRMQEILQKFARIPEPKDLGSFDPGRGHFEETILNLRNIHQI